MQLKFFIVFVLLTLSLSEVFAQNPCVSQPNIVSTNPSGVSTTVVCNGRPLTLSADISLATCPDCTYEWSDGSTGAYVFAFAPGSYTVTVTDNAPGGCIGVSTQVNITATTLAVPTFAKDSNHICNGASALLQVSNPCTSCDYEWFTSDPAGGTTSVSAPPTSTSSYSASVAGDYFVRVTDASTPVCRENSALTLVRERTVSTPPLISNTLSICDSNVAVMSTINCQNCHYEWQFYDFLPEGKLIISGVFHGTRLEASPTGSPAGIELYAIGNIPDLSDYTLTIHVDGGAANAANGGTTVTYTLPSSGLSASSFIYLTDNAANFTDFFGFTPYAEFSSLGTAVTIDGNEAIELSHLGTPVDAYGNAADITGTVSFPSGVNWTYHEGWAYRRNYNPPSSSVVAPNATFNNNNWINGEGKFNTLRDNDFWGTDKMPVQTYTNLSSPNEGLIITAVFADNTAGTKTSGIELYAQTHINDLSDYTIEVIPDGSGVANTAITLPAGAIRAGTRLYITENTTEFNAFFTTVSAAATVIQNTAIGVLDGNDAVRVLKNNTPIDLFGESTYTGAVAWEYTEGWALTNASRSPSTTFDPTEWTFGNNAWVNCPTNSTGDCVSGGASTGLSIGSVSFTNYTSGMALSAVYDANRRTAAEARGIELYVYDEVDLSNYSINLYRTGSTTVDNVPLGTGTLLGGNYIYITSDAAQLAALYPGLTNHTVIVDAGMSVVSGNTAIELVFDGVAVDIIGDKAYNNGSVISSFNNMPWAYTDGWLYRAPNVAVNGGTFDAANWTLSKHGYRGRNEVYGTDAMNVNSYINTNIGTELQILQVADTSFLATSTTGDYKVRVTYDNGCVVSSDFISLDTLVFEPRITAYAPTSKQTTTDVAYLCSGSTVELAMDANSFYQTPPTWTYKWSRNTILDTTERGYRFSATAPGLYQATVTDDNGCTSYTNIIEVINSTNGANPSISASSTALCSQTATATLTTSPCTGCSYAWRTEADDPPSSPPDNNINYIVNGNGLGGQSGGYFVRVTDLVSSCTYESDIVEIKDTTYPSPVMTSSGNTVCSATAITLATASCPGCEYEWQIDTSTAFTTIGITQQATYQTRISGNYRVRTLYPNGCETGYSNTIQATFQTVSANIATPPLTSICNGEPVIINALPTYTDTTCNGCTYTFLRNGVAMQPDTFRRDSQNITVAGNYQVVVANDRGCADTSALITFQEVSVNTAIRRSAEKICSSNSEVIMEVDSCNNCTYQWYIGNTSLITSRDTFYRAVGYAARNGYSVEVTKEGCMVRDSFYLDTVTERFVVIAVDTTVSPSATMCDGSAVVLVDTCQICTNNNQYRYQWYSLTNTIAGASFESYQVDTAGTYYVSTIDNNNCVVVSNSITVQEFSPDPNLALDFSTLGANGVVPITYGSFSLDRFLFPSSLRSRGGYTSLTAQGAIDPTTDSLDVGIAGSGYHFITYTYRESNSQGFCDFSTLDTLEVLGAVEVNIVNTKTGVPPSEACIGDILEITLTNFTFVPDTVTFVAGGGNTISVGVSPSLSSFAGVFSGSFTVQVPDGARTGKVTLTDANNSFESPNFFVIQNPAVTIDLVSTIQPICSNLDTATLRGLPAGGTLTASYLNMPVDSSLMIDTFLLLDSVEGYVNGVQQVKVYYNYIPTYTASDSTCPAVLDSIELEIRDTRLDSVEYTPIAVTQASEPMVNLTRLTYPLSAANYPNSYTGTYILANNILPSNLLNTLPAPPTQIIRDGITYEYNNGGCVSSSVDSIDLWPAPSILDSIPVFLCSQDDTVFIERDPTGVTMRYRNQTVFEGLYAYSQNVNVSVGNPIQIRYSEYINLMEITTSNGGVDSVNFFAPNEQYYFVPANVTGNSTRITLKFKYNRIANYFSGGTIIRTDTTSYTIAEVSKVFQIEDPSVVSINPALLADTVFCPVSINTQLLGSPAGGAYYLSGGTVPYQRLANNIYNPMLYPIDTSYQLTYVYEGRACVDSAATGIYVPDTFSIAVQPDNLTGEYCLTSPNDTVRYTLPYGTNTIIDGSSAQFFINGIQTGTIFSPSQVGPPGMYNVRYVVSDIYGCTEEATDIFQVFPIPVLSMSPIDSVFCLNDDTTQVQLYEASDTMIPPVNVTTWPTGSGVPLGHIAIFDGAGVVDGGQMTNTNPGQPYFFPRTAGVGLHPLRYVYVDDNGCMDSINFEIEVLPLPVVSMTTTNRRPLEPYYCEHDSIPLFGSPVGTSLNSGYGSYMDSVLHPTVTTSSLDSADTAFEPFVQGFTPGIVREWLYYYYEDRNGCRDTAFYDVRIRNFTTDPILQGFSNAAGSICASDTNVLVVADPNGGFDLDSLGWFTSSFTQAFSQLTDTANTASVLFYPDSTGIQFADRDVIVTFHYTDTARVCFNSISDTITVLALPHLTLSERLVTSLPAMDPIGSKLIAPRTDTFYHICETDPDVPIYAYNTTGFYDPFTGNISLFIPDHISPDTGVYIKGNGVVSNNGAGGNIAYAYRSSVVGFGLDTIRYVYEDVRGCIDSVDYYVVVDSLPVLSFAGLSNYDSSINRYVYCEAEPNPPSILPAPTGVRWTMTFDGQNITSVPFDLTPSTLAVPGVYMDYAMRYDYTGQVYQSGATCSSFLEDTIQIRPSPQMAWVIAPTDFCMSDSNQRVPLSATPYGGTFVDATNNFQVIAGIVGDSLFNPSAQAGKRDLYYYYLDTVSGCDDTIQHTIYVYAKPQINFDLTGGCSGQLAELVPRTAPYGLQYNGVAIDSITQVIWDFGDGVIDTFDVLPDTLFVPRNTHTYTGYGIFYPSLTVVNQGVCDSTFTRRIVISPKITPYDTLPYIEPFDNAANGWFQASADTLSVNGIVQDSLWEWGIANGNTINTVLSGNNAWVTGLNQTYGQGENAWVYSPCFDLTYLDRPMIKLDVWRAAQNGFDGAVLQYYDDSTQTWKVLGRHGKGINWYQDEFVVSSPGNQTGVPTGWTGSNITWEDARYRLDNVGEDLRGRDNIRFRVAFASDPGTLTGRNDGFAFDNVMVGNRSRNVLVEHFSAVGYPGIEGIENALYRTIYNNLYGRDVHLIQYHSDEYIPNDAIYLMNPVDNRQRFFIYNVSDPDEVRVDGKFVANKTSELLNYPELEILDVEALEDPKFKIEFLTFPSIQFNGPSSGMQATIRVTALEDMPGSTYSIMATVTKDSVESITGHTTRAVLLDNYPNNLGTSSFRSWLKDDFVDVQVSLPDVNPTLHPNTSLLQLVVFVQDVDATPKEIFQVETTRDLSIYTGPVDTLNDISVDKLPGMEATQFVLYPNPAVQQFQIDFDAPLEDDYDWYLVNTLGQSLRQGKATTGTSTIQVDTDDLTAGFYVFVIRNKNIYAQRKVIVKKP